MISCVNTIDATVAGTGVMFRLFVAEMLTPTMLNSRVWAAALFSARLGDATPLAKVTLIVLGVAVRTVPLKLP